MKDFELSKVQTTDLIEELKKREGVGFMFVEQDEQSIICLEGFATVLIIKD